MYKCGWNGCEKAYGTLNHLNAHVTMQSHGAKRTPEGELTTAFLPRSRGRVWIPGGCDLEIVANGWIGLAPATAALVG